MRKLFLNQTVWPFVLAVLAGLTPLASQASAHFKVRRELISARACWMMAQGVVRLPETVWQSPGFPTTPRLDRSADRRPPLEGEFRGHTPVRVMALNLLDLAVSRKDARKLRNKSEAQVLELQRLFLTTSPDLAVLPEAGSARALEALLGGRGSSLREAYDIRIARSENGAGEIGFLVSRNWLRQLNLEVRENDLGRQTWYDPARREVVSLYHRGLPTLELWSRATGATKPLLTVIGYHGKSMRDREQDPKSYIVRVRQLKALNEVIRHLAEVHGPDHPVMVAGDFNVKLTRAPEAEFLDRSSLSAFATAREVTTPSDLITQVHIDRDGQVHQDQLDDVRVNRALTAKVLSARVERYLDSRGQLMPFPQSERENRAQPSDHLPVVVDIALPRD